MHNIPKLIKDKFGIRKNQTLIIFKELSQLGSCKKPFDKKTVNEQFSALN